MEAHIEFVFPFHKAFQRFLAAQDQPSTNGINTGADENAMVYYHKIGTDQCKSGSSLSNQCHLIYI